MSTELTALVSPVQWISTRVHEIAIQGPSVGASKSITDRIKEEKEVERARRTEELRRRYERIKEQLSAIPPIQEGAVNPVEYYRRQQIIFRTYHNRKEKTERKESYYESGQEVIC
ncbi:hypothetical protein CMO89_04565 [Candidatus Woesearchaeota archaeon]|nr:hypothetical protein [Candidatus Woesearchaeota archaeon]|tara:strand:- start:19001 stop:19345 length:345 start_codon:yes stop_codon:yes gene_type:complete